jgi:hypothetical protein
MSVPFSAIVQDPVIRQLVQENLLERAFHDALFPRLLFRMEAVANKFPGQLGDTIIFTGDGLIEPQTKPLRPRQEPTPASYASEQWEATVQQYANTIDTHMPSSMLAIASLFTRNANKLGIAAGQSINRVVRDRIYNSALAGTTFYEYAPGDLTTGSGSIATGAAIRVRSLNGLTTARRPDLAAGSPVRFQAVSSNNPLGVTIYHAGGHVHGTITAFTPDNAGDEIGPGVVTCNWSGGNITINARQAIVSDDASSIVRMGGGTTIDAIPAAGGTGTFFALATIRSAVARMRNMNVAEQADGYYHCHLDPVSESQVYGDAEFQRLLTSMPDYYIYSQFALGRLLGTVFLRDNECPQSTTVTKVNGLYTTDEPCAAEVVNKTGVVLHQPVFIGAGAINEYYCDLDDLVTEAGVTGKTSNISVSNGGIQVAAERIKYIIRAPLDRLQQEVSTSYSFIGDWAMRTDATTGDAARFKRCVVVQHGA